MGLVVRASGRRIGLEACFFFFGEADYFAGESEQFRGVSLDGSLTTEFYPTFSPRFQSRSILSVNRLPVRTYFCPPQQDWFAPDRMRLHLVMLRIGVLGRRDNSQPAFAILRRARGGRLSSGARNSFSSGGFRGSHAGLVRKCTRLNRFSSN